MKVTLYYFAAISSAVGWLAVSTCAMAEKAQAQSVVEESHASAESASIRMLELEVQSLKARVDKLEEGYKGSVGKLKKNAANSVPWHDISNWEKIKVGMSRSQVEDLLGSPAKVEMDGINYVTLIYQGQRYGSGYISGNVRLDNTDRVIFGGLNKPVM